jgi:hypothetical protein
VSAGLSSATSNPVIWQALTTLACCDRAVIVCLEAIRGLVGAPYPTVSKLPPPGSKKVRRRAAGPFPGHTQALRRPLHPHALC